MIRPARQSTQGSEDRPVNIHPRGFSWKTPHPGPGFRKGLLTPDPALLGALAVGTATQDYFFTDAAQSSGGLQLTGLHPGLTFDLRIFATRATDETRVSRYTVSGRTERSRTLVTSGLGIGSTGGNGNDDTVLELRRVHPDCFGQIFIELEPEVGSYAYLGILELVVRPPLPSAAPGPVLAP